MIKTYSLIDMFEICYLLTLMELMGRSFAQSTM